MKNNNSPKPINLREETWQFLQENIKDNKLIDKINEDSDYPFGKILYELGILNHPSLLQNTVIELDDEAEYVITVQAALSLSSNSKVVVLIGLGTNKAYIINTARVINAMKDGDVFDQLDYNLENKNL